MDVRMGSECLSPGVQDREEADSGAEMPGVGCDFEQGGGAGFKEQREQEPLVLPHQRHECMRHAEDQVVVADRQQLLLPLREPLIASASLALGTVPVATGVIGDSLMSAARTLIAMTAECRRAAACDRV
jgi:hypothetical protein